MPVLIEIQDVHKVYDMGEDKVRALDGVSLVIQEGEYVAIMGPSGSGKSTLMNLVGCLDTPTAGSYKLKGNEVAGMTDDELAAIRNAQIGFIFQTFNLLPRSDAVQNVELPLVYAGVPRRERRERAQESLKAVGLGDRMHHRPNEMSGGQRQRVAVARALVNRPSILMADEPTGNLDSRTGEEIMSLMDQLHSQGKTIILVTHEEDLALRAARVVRLRDGKILSDVRNAPLAARKGMILENLWLALRSLWAHKMRSFLTTLGIIIGVCAVITVVSLVQGFSQVITREIEGLGANSIIVEPFRPPGKEGEKLARVEMTLADGESVLAASRYVDGVAPLVQNFEKIKVGEEVGEYPVLGTTPVFQDLRNYYVEHGRFFAAVDDRERLNVCVLGHGLLKDLKLPSRPMGRELQIGAHSFRIIGVMEPKGQLLGQDFDKFVMIPFGTAVGIYGDTVAKRVAFLMHVRDATQTDQAKDEITDLLRIRHRLRSDQPNDFEVTTQNQILETVNKFSNGITYVVAGVTAIALLVGGIGIMNIMLVSVTERTREIGVRKAVGAKRAHILSQFVIEAVVLALSGGVLGIALGVGLGALIAAAIPNWPGSYVPLWATVLSFGFSSAVGLFFGIYPAAKAARLDPIESLRYE